MISRTFPRLILLLLLLIGVLQAGCSSPALIEPSVPIINTASPPPAVAATIDQAESVGGLSEYEISTLSSLEKVDDHPLFTMRYFGAYDPPQTSFLDPDVIRKNRPISQFYPSALPAWGCSLFAALGDHEKKTYGRNFDWQPSPAVLLFTNPPDKYASVSLVDIEYLGFTGETAGDLLDLSLIQRQPLLGAPRLPFDGMNEHGLVVGMAAVPPGNVPNDPNKQTIGSLGIIREILDHAKNLDEALAIFQQYNINFGGGPPIHYLLATPAGDAILVELYQGKMVVTPNNTSWHQATNFLVASGPDSPENNCKRYDAIQEELAAENGSLSPIEAMDLLARVAQGNTQWSVVYGMDSRQIELVMGRKYDQVHPFNFDQVLD